MIKNYLITISTHEDEQKKYKITNKNWSIPLKS